MVVRRAAVIALAIACVAPWAYGQQDGYVRAWVESPLQRAEQPFWIFVEASGLTVEMPVIPEIDGLVVNRTSPNQARSFSISPGRAEQSIKLAYRATAVRAGEITIPPIEVVVNGAVMRTEPLTVTIEGMVTQTPSSRVSLRVWIEGDDIVAGRPFWLYIQATGGDVMLPDEIVVDGLRIDTKNIMRSTSHSFGAGATEVTRKNGYHCTALRAGEIVVPPIQVFVDNVPMTTDALTVTVLGQPDPTANRVAGASGETPELTREDLLFIRMETDKTEVYQGEPILLTKQLWRIIYRRIESGPYRGQLIVPPSTEGFYVTYLEPLTYKASNGPWEYEVSEERLLLYPTAIGSLRIGQWHWEGIALINRQNIMTRERFHYKLNGGPIDIKVKPLPDRPDGFSGAVGQFVAEASISGDSVMQGVPIKLAVTVTGRGNPDAIGPPVLGDIAWGQIRDPETETKTYIASDTNLPTVARTFSYAIVPLEEGQHELPAVDFVYFDPQEEAFRTETSGPFQVAVFPSAEVRRRMVVGEDVELEQQGVNVLAEDIRPIVTDVGSLSASRPLTGLLSATTAAPMLAYLALLFGMNRKRRFARDTGFARAYRAKATVERALTGVPAADAPSVALYAALTGFVADTFNVDGSGMTSAEVRGLLDEYGIDPDATARLEKILKACERVHYASQTISTDELTALLRGAESVIGEIDAAAKRMKRG